MSPDADPELLEWIRAMCAELRNEPLPTWPGDLADRIRRGIAQMEKDDRRRARMRRKKRRGWA